MDKEKEHIDAVFRKLFTEYYYEIHKFICKRCGNSDLAHDYANEASTRLYVIWDERYALPESANIGWLKITAKNIISNDYHAHIKCSTNVFDDNILYDFTEDKAMSKLERDDHFRSLLENIKKSLTEYEWELFVLIYLKHKKYHEAAKITNVKLNTTRTNIRRLRIKLCKILSEKYDIKINSEFFKKFRKSETFAFEKEFSI